MPDESTSDSARDLRAIARLDAVPALLDVLCDATGMGCAAVARLTDVRWMVYAVKDDIGIGLRPGDTFDLHSALILESPAPAAAIVIEQASADPRFRNHPVTSLYGIESYLSVPIFMPDGRCFGMLCVIDRAPIPLSDRRNLSMCRRIAALIGKQIESELSREQQLTALIDERAMNDLREQFIAILGHDLRNPLQAVLATSDLLERRLEDSFGKGMASRIKTNARRMSQLIDDVLDLAQGRLGQGIAIQMSEAGDITMKLVAVVRELQDAQPARHVLTDINVAESIYCDAGRVQQLASNLVANALTHGSVQSVVRVSAIADDGFLVFSVWNDGEPIPASCIDRVFEPFWRHSTAGSRSGLGLGLFICAQIVRAHHGQISVTSTRTGGTAFVARLPLRPLSKLPGAHPAAAPPATN